MRTSIFVSYKADFKLLSRIYQQREKEQAATDSALSTYQQQSEHQAAIEAAVISAPDALTPVPSDSKFMSGGRSSGDLELSNTNPEEIPTGVQTDNPIEVALRPLTSEIRPTLAAGQNHMSVQSISQLHVPGEFPKGGTS
jgi:hypothetical protein